MEPPAVENTGEVKQRRGFLGLRGGSFDNPYIVIVTTLAAFLFSQVVAIVCLMVVFGFVRPGVSIVNLLDESVAAQFTYVLIAEMLAVWLVWVVLKRRRLGLAAIGLGRRPVLRDIKWAVAGFVCFYAALIGVSVILRAINPGFDDNQVQDVGFKTLNSSTDQLLAFLALVVFPPIGEEVLVRGYLFSGLRQKWSFAVAGLVTSLLFGAAHLSSGEGSTLLWLAGLNTFLLSLVLVFLREKTAALYAGILVHAMNNAIAFAVHFNH